MIIKYNNKRWNRVEDKPFFTPVEEEWERKIETFCPYCGSKGNCWLNISGERTNLRGDPSEDTCGHLSLCTACWVPFYFEVGVIQEENKKEIVKELLQGKL